MSTQKQKTTVIVCTPDHEPKTFTVDGFAGVTVTQKENNHQCFTILVGDLSISDLFALYKGIVKELLPTIRKLITEDSLESLLEMSEEFKEEWE